ncbi:YadA-like family protein [Neisseria zalophi]|uniref:Adhesin n=1 Tax=Neisseria zalophi TaxID=640030 RepID=A0A5J6PRX0_9NEIS|nr:YadA-like family protein [Neisseria zalophi]QEY25471.1 hypothetical protein D0T92_02225 [Neisseria zalophi]
MNKSYRSIWNESLGAWVAVSEIENAKGKPAGSRMEGAARKGGSIGLKATLRMIPFMLLAMGSQAFAANTNVYFNDGNDNTCVYVNENGGSSNIALQSNNANCSPSNKTTQTDHALFYKQDGKVGLTMSGQLHVTSGEIGLGGAPNNNGKFVIGSEPTLAEKANNGKGSIAIGASNSTATKASGSDSLAIGNGSESSGEQAITLGRRNIASAENAIAAGIESQAKGTNSIAMGNKSRAGVNKAGETQAGLRNDVAIGNGTVAYGGSTVALGNDANTSSQSAIAIGDGASARGGRTIAVGNGANSTGTEAIAVGIAAKSHAWRTIAQGAATEATADEAIAIGNSTRATDVKTTAVGSSANASDARASAFGSESLASGERALAAGFAARATAFKSVALGGGANSENSFSTALGNEAHAEGNKSVALGAFAHALGNQSVALGSGNTGGAGANAEGDQSIAIGGNVNAEGNSSIAIGGDDLDKIATENPTAAEKLRSLTGVEIKEKEYFNTRSQGDASVAIGVKTVASGHLSTAFGTFSESSGIASVALGIGSKATKDGSVALGAGSKTDGTAQYFPEATVKTLDETGAEDGGEVTYTGFAGGARVGEGDQVSVGSAGYERQIKNVAPGAINKNSTDAINGSQLAAIVGKGQYQTQNYFHVNEANPNQGAGNPTTNFGKIRDKAGALGEYALTAGVNAVARGSEAISLGHSSTAAGLNSVALGRESNAHVEDGIAIGYQAQTNDDIPLTPNNADSYIGSIAIGRNSHTSGKAAVAMGLNTKAYGRGAVAIGDYANATSTGQAIALGAGSVSKGVGSIAIGSGSNTSKTLSVIIGSGTQATVERAVALGASSVADVAGGQEGVDPLGTDVAKNNSTWTATTSAVSVGKGTEITRQITSVAAGTKDTDAVNVAQLKAAGFKLNTTSSNGGEVSGQGEEKVQNGETVTIDAGKNIKITQNQKKISVATKDVVEFDKVTAGNTVLDDSGVSVGGNVYVSDAGLNANNKALKDVAAGKDGKDAVNVSQLNPLAEALGTEIDQATGTINKPSFVVSKADGGQYDAAPTLQEAFDHVGTEIRKPITFAGNSGNTTKKLGESLTIQGGLDNSAAASDKNLRTKVENGVMSIELAESPKFGNVTINNDGKITGLANGEAPTDAVNRSQLDAAAAKAANKVEAGKNITVDETPNKDGSTTYTVKTKDIVEFDKVTAGNTVLDDSGVSVDGNVYISDAGLNANDKVIGNVAAGKGGKDVVNVSQLNPLAEALGTEIDPTTGEVAAPLFVVTKADGSKYDGTPTIQGALNNIGTEIQNPITFVGDDEANKFDRKLGSQVNLKGGADKTKLSDNNIGVVSNGTDRLDIKLSKELKELTSADFVDQAGNRSTLNGDGITINPANNGTPVSLTSSGLNNGNNVLSGVAEGVNNTDAVNKAQLDKAAAKAANKVAAGKNIEVEDAANPDGSTTYTVKTKDEVEFNRVTLGDTVIDKNSGDIVGLKNTDLGGDTFAKNKRAATEEQLNAAQDNLKTILGGNAANDKGKITTTDIGGTGANTIHDAIKSVRETANTGWNLTAQGQNKSNVAPGDTVDLSNEDGNIVITKKVDSEDITFDLAKDIKVDSLAAGDTVLNKDGVKVGNNTALTSDGLKIGTDNGTKAPVVLNADGLNNGNNAITNVAAGKNNTDAVNVSQLTPVAKALGMSFDVANGTVSAPSFVVTKADGSKYDGTPTIQGALNNIGTEIQNPITFVGDDEANKFDRKLGSQVNLKGGADKTKLSDNNIGVVSNGTDRLDIKLSKELKELTSADFVDQAGNRSTLNGDGITINPANNGTPVSLTSSGLNNGNNVLSGVAEGVNNTDAVNKAQLDKAAAKAANKVAAGKNIEVEDAANPDGSTTYTVKTKDEVEFNRVTLGDTVIDKNSGDIVGLKNTDLGGDTFAKNKRAATEEQLNAAQDNLKTVLGGNAKNTNGNITIDDIGGTGAGNINDAIKSVRETANAGWNLTAEGKNSSNVAAGETVDLNSADKNIVISKADDSDKVTFDLADNIKVDSATAGDTVLNKDGVKVGDSTALTSDGLTVKDDASGKTVKLTANGLDNGNNVVANVTAGKNNTDAVNVSQLKPMVQALGMNVDPNSGTVSAPSFVVSKVDGTSYDGVNTVQAALKHIGTEIRRPIHFNGNIGNVSRKGDETLNIQGGLSDSAAASDRNIRTKIDGETMSIELAEAPRFGNVTINDNGKISGVEAATVAAGSKEAVNGAQLYKQGKGVENIIGGKTVYNPDNGTYTNADIGGTGTDNVNDAIAAVRDSATAGWNLTAEGQNSSNVAPSDTVDLNNTDGNIVITKKADSDNVTFDLAKTIKVESLTAGDTTVNNDGVKVGDNTALTSDGLTIKDAASGQTVSLTDKGLNNGGKVISGVANGLVAQGSQEAVNGDQLFAVDQKAVANAETLSRGLDFAGNSGNFNRTLGERVTVKGGLDNKEAASDTNIRTVADSTGNIQVLLADAPTFKGKLTAQGLDAGGQKITGVKDGENAGDAVNIAQLQRALENQAITQQSLVQANSPFSYVNSKGEVLARQVDKQGNEHFVKVEDGSEYTEKDITISALNPIDPQTAVPTVVGNIADGKKANDAVNVGQLKNVVKSLGGGAEVNPDGSIKDPVYNITKNNGGNATVNNIGDALGLLNDEINKPLVFVGDNNTVKVARKLDTELAVKGGATGKLTDNNIGVTGNADDNSLEVKLAENINLGKDGSVTTGQTVLNNDGVKVGNNVALTSDGLKAGDVNITYAGIDAGNKKITGVKAGENATDAVNKAQLDAVQAAASNKVTVGKNLTAKEVKNADGSLTYNVATADDVAFDSIVAGQGDNQVLLNNKGVNVGGNTYLSDKGVNANNKKVANVAKGDIAEDSTDAVNGSQLYQTADSVAKLLGGNAKVSPEGSLNMTDIGGTGANNINDAIQSLNRSVAGAKVTVAAGDNIVVDKTVKAGGATDYVVSTAKDLKVDSVTAGNTVLNDNGLSIANGPSVTVNGLDAGDKKVTNVANGEVSATSKDAVNGSQLYQAYQVLGGNNTSINTKDAPANNSGNGNTTPAGTVTTVVTNADGSKTTTTEINQKVAVSADKGGNEYTLTTYNVEGQNTYVTNDVIQAIGKMNEQGIKFFHTNDGEVKPVVQGSNQEDSSASGAYATAVGYQTSASGKGSLALGNTYTVVDQNGNAVQDSNGQAQTQRTQATGVNAIAIGSGAQANETNTIAIGTGNIVNGKHSGAIGDPTIIKGDNTYSVGNNNKVDSSSTFVFGNNVTKTMDNSVILGDESAATEIHTTAKGGNYTYAGVNDANVAGVQDVKGVVSVGAEGQTRQVQNVAAGVVSQTSTDAINGSQLHHTNAAINAVGNHVVNMGNQLNQKIDDVETRSNAGTASAMAVAGLPQAYMPGKNMMAVSGSSYRGQSAYAIGYSSISDNGNWVIKGTATGNSRGHYGATAGVGYQW